MALSAGERFGPFEIVAPLGAGGMGEVWRARDTRLDRDVAIKVLPEKFFEDRERRARFDREAKALAAVNHPNIAAVYSFEEASGRHLLVHELLEGRTLREALAEGPLPIRRALEIGEKIAAGLSAAHEKGIVHRDLKPENVFLIADGIVKILDFGLARHDVSRRDASDTRSPTLSALSEPGGVFGTLAYMSPEQARGEAVDFRSDQFSFGIVLHEMLAGRRPFAGRSATEILASILRDEPEPLERAAPGVPPPVRWIVERCVSKEPSERYASTRDLARDLATCRAHLSEAASGPLAKAPAAPTPRSRAARVIGLAAMGLLLILLGRLTRRPPAGGGGVLASSRHFRRLTSLPGAESWPALSPDGATLAYVKEVRPGKTDIFVQRIGGHAALNLTTESQGGNLQPAFSPDGTRMAFRSDRDGGGLFVMGALGGSVRRLTDFGFEPAWFPDGRTIAFGTRYAPRPDNRYGRSELWTVSVDTGEKKRLVGEDAEQPSVSPHALRIAYWAVAGGSGSSRDIFTIPAEGLSPGESPVPVTRDSALDWNPFWSPDGRYLYFGSDRDGTLNLWRVPIDERTGRTLGVSEPVPVPAWRAGPFSAASDGRRIAFQNADDEYALEKIPLDPASGRTVGAPQTILKTNLSLVVANVSPRGDALAFSSLGLEEDLWMIRADGTGLRKVTDDPPRDRAPSFSPDGTRLAFHSDRDGFWNIWTIGVDGSGLTQITSDKAAALFYPIFSPDGAKLAVWSFVTGPRILPSDTRPGVPLPQSLPPPEKGFAFFPTSWSPDGRKLAGFRWEASGLRTGLLLYDVGSGAYERLTESGNYPVASGDGRRLFYLDRGNVLVFDLSSRISRVVYEGSHDRPLTRHSIGADGRTLYVVRRFEQSDIWLLDSR